MNAAAPIALTIVHGAENRFALLDERHLSGGSGGYESLAEAACAQFTLDGLLVVSGEQAGVRMRIFNSDGSEAEMCGNGIRCVVRYLVERDGIAPASVMTAAGAVPTSVVSQEPFTVRAALGEVSFPLGAVVQRFVPPHAGEFIAVSVGNPHAVVFVEDEAGVDLAALAALFAADARYPEGVNVHAVRTIDEATLSVRHFERGAGETRACGSGAVACAAAAIMMRGARSPVDVYVPGGVLKVRWEPGTSAELEGPAELEGERTLRV